MRWRYWRTTHDVLLFLHVMYAQDWGEGFGGVRTTRLFLASFVHQRAVAIPSIPDDVILAGQPVVVTDTSDAAVIAYTGWQLAAANRKLGVCSLRPTFLSVRCDCASM